MGPGSYEVLSHRSTGSVKLVSRNGSMSGAKRETGDNFILKDSGPNATMRSHQSLRSISSNKSVTSLGRSSRFN